MRYNPDGSLDTTSDAYDALQFGTGGIITTPIAGTETSIAHSVAVDLAGRIVAGRDAKQ